MILEDLDDKEFLELLYKTVLDREPDDSGFNEHLQKLGEGGRTRLATVGIFLESEEYREENDVPYSDSSFYKGEEVIVDWNNEKLYYLRKLVRAVSHVPGAVLELGVHKGRTAKILVEASEKDIYLFDTFEGIPEDVQLEDYDFSDTSVSHVKSKLPQSEQYRVRIVQGDVRETTGQYSQNISFAHFDLDEYHSTLAALQNLYPKASESAIFLFDQYGYREFEDEERRGGGRVLIR